MIMHVGYYQKLDMHWPFLIRMFISFSGQDHWNHIPPMEDVLRQQIKRAISRLTYGTFVWFLKYIYPVHQTGDGLTHTSHFGQNSLRHHKLAMNYELKRMALCACSGNCSDM